MNGIEESIIEKRKILKEQITGIKSFSIDLKDDLQADQQRLKKISLAYEHSDSLLQRTNQQIDKLLAQSEVRAGIYVVGICAMLFVLVWKFYR
jgi:hypothetical protein